jgi:hypothetical protein
VTPEPRICPIHGKPGVLIYPCCVGAKGGAQKSKRKAEASRRNGKKGGRPPNDRRSGET